MATARCSPASSCRKCPPPAMVTDSAPGTAGQHRCHADVIGSLSLNATRNGLSQVDSRCQAAVGRRRRVVGRGRDEIRHRPRRGLVGLVRERSVVGGEHLGRRSSVRQPDRTRRATSSTGAVRTASRKRSHTSGICWSPVGSPVLVATTRAIRSGFSVATRRPIRPPQSWPTTVSRPAPTRRTRTSATIQRAAA